MLIGEYKYSYEGDNLIEILPDGTRIVYKNSGEIFFRCTSTLPQDPPDPLGGG